MAPVAIGDRQWAVTAAIARIERADAALAALEVRQHFGITPAGIALCCPVVVVASLAARAVEAIDRSRAAEGATLGRRDGPASRAFARLGLELPGVFRVVGQLDEAGRNVNEQVVVRRARFQQADRDARIGRQPIRQHAAGRTGTDDDEIKHLGRVGFGGHVGELQAFAMLLKKGLGAAHSRWSVPRSSGLRLTSRPLSRANCEVRPALSPARAWRESCRRLSRRSSWWQRWCWPTEWSASPRHRRCAGRAAHARAIRRRPRRPGR